MNRSQRFWRGKRVFLTGHTGFKGAWLCAILEETGATVTGYALAPPTQPNLYDIRRPDVRSVIGDIRNFAQLFAAYKQAAPEVVIHMAAQPLVLDSYHLPRATYETNLMGTVNLLECARLTGSAPSLLNVTTDKVYLNHEEGRKENSEEGSARRNLSGNSAGFCEEARLDGYDPYSNSKSCSELVTASYRRSFFSASGTAVSTVRSGNVIGGGDFSPNRLIPDCVRAAAQNESCIIRNPSSVRPYQHVLDTLFAYLLVAEKQYETPELAGSYNIGPAENTHVTSGKLADLFCAAWGRNARWEHLSRSDPYESKTLTLDCSKINRVLGWTPRWKIEPSVRATVEWYQEWYGGGGANTVMERQIREFWHL